MKKRGTFSVGELIAAAHSSAAYNQEHEIVDICSEFQSKLVLSNLKDSASCNMQVEEIVNAPSVPCN